MPDQEEVEFVRENVTVIFKSFERQKMAKRLYENLQKYYPGVRVVIADDSRKPLDLKGDSLTIVFRQVFFPKIGKKNSQS